MWSELRGRWGYRAGTSGTPAVPKGSQIIRIVVHASADGASFAINGGDAVPVVNGSEALDLLFPHLLIVSPHTQDPVVFTGTDKYMVEFVTPS